MASFVIATLLSLKVGTIISEYIKQAILIFVIHLSFEYVS
jgi:hypothetical protein